MKMAPVTPPFPVVAAAAAAAAAAKHKNDAVMDQESRMTYNK